VKQILDVWASLNMRRKLITIVATVAMFAAILSLTRLATSPSLSLLYSGLESGPAGEIVRSLEQRGVTFEVRGGSIYVDTMKRDELRMTLASEGLPANNNRGYELLDSLSGFGTTSQMFDAAYWRAKEGELARTITGSPHINSARVHIANTSSNPFQRDITPTASVSISTSGGPLPGNHVRALKYLIASAVTGLDPEDVAIIDGIGGLIGTGEENAPATGIEDRAEAIRQRVQRLLEARVGYGNAVVEVSLDTVTESETLRERVFDPGSRVAISTETEERTTSSKDSGNGDVTVASNIPDGDGASSDSSSSQNSETRERVNYEVSETSREITREPGAIKRLTVAVLVNDIQTSDEASELVTETRSDIELASLKELISSAVGFDEERGDVITLKSMAFQPVIAQGTAGGSSLLGSLALDLMTIIQMSVLALVTLILGLFVVKPLLLSKVDSQNVSTPRALSDTSGPLDTDDAGSGLTPLTGEIAMGEFGMNDANLAELPAVSSEVANFDPGLASSNDPVERLRTMIGERQEETVEILRSWLEDSEEKA
jgi:flagellar M-ring protein FliF